MGIKLLERQQPTRLEGPPEGIKPLNDSVYELYTPPQGVPKVVVIFFHGLSPEADYSTAYWRTWLSRDGTIVWPKEWLAEKFPGAQILSVSYDSLVPKHDGSSDSYEISENLIQNIILEYIGQDCPVVLVGHSLGGIIIKEFILACFRKMGQLWNNVKEKPIVDLIKKFLGNCKGVFYYSTPHNGSRFLDYLVKKQVNLNDPLMKLLKVLSFETARINSEFANARTDWISAYAIAENLDTTYMGFTGRMVKESSARHDIESFYTAPDANHFDVCKAKSKTCNIFKNLHRCIMTAMNEPEPGLRATFLPVLVPEDYVPTGNKASTSQPAKRKLPGETRPPPTDNNQTIKQLNDSVFQLYSPPQGVPKAVVIFFHGLSLEADYRTAYWKTWLSRDGQSVWPKEWLAQELPRAQILSVSYDSCVVKHDGEADSYIIAENLISDLILGDEGVGQNCPVVLVGHSLGGIIIKEFLLACLNERGESLHRKKAKLGIERIENFLGNCKGVFYYSTPHEGSEFIDYLARSPNLPLNDMMKLFKTLSKEAGRINHEFKNVRLGEGILIEAMGETLDTTYMGFTGRIVEYASAIQDKDRFYSPPQANHFDVCKPTNRETCSIFRKLLSFVDVAIHNEMPGLRGRILNMRITLQDTRNLQDTRKQDWKK